MGGKNGKNCAIKNCIISAGGAIKLHFFGTSAEESATILSCFCGENIKIGVMEIKKHAPFSNFSTLCYVISRILCGVNVMKSVCISLFCVFSQRSGAGPEGACEA